MYRVHSIMLYIETGDFMFGITYEMILRESTALLLKKGSEYYKQKRVETLRYNQDKLSFDAIVVGTKPYKAHLRFEAPGGGWHAHCTCQDYDFNTKFCKHIIAVLLIIKGKDEQGYFNSAKSKDAARHIFDFFQNAAAMPKTPVKLEVTFEFYPGSSREIGGHAALSLRIGLDKLYIVRDIKKLFEYIEKNKELEFGKKFTFDPLKHRFGDGDKPLVSFLKELYEVDRLTEKMSHGFNRGSLFADKTVSLTNKGIKRFFGLVGNNSVRVLFKDSLYEDVRIVEEDFQVSFMLQKEDQSLVLKVDCPEPLVPFTEDGEYFFTGDVIYKTSKKHRESFKPFYMAIHYQRSNKIYFLDEDKERFISEVLPFAEKAGEVTIDEAVSSMIDRVPLEAEIYLDRLGDTITVEVRFAYGEKLINPFAPAQRVHGKEDKILIREVVKEGIILDILGASGLKVKNYKAYVDEEDKVFDFITDILPRLQEYTRVFYSENFNKTIIRGASFFTGGIRLNSSTDMLELSFSMEGIETSEIDRLLQSLREKKKFYRLKDGSFLPLNSREIREMEAITEYLELDREDFEKSLIEIPKFRAFYLDERLREAGLNSIERNNAFKAFVQSIKEPSDIDLKVPQDLKGILRDYQKFGFKWLKTLSIYKLGGVLADDMGLGKTLQTLALVLSDKLEHGTMASLVVAPTSLVYNWYEEVEKFAPRLKTLIVSGNKDERQKQMEDVQGADIVITSYPLIRRDIEEYKGIGFRYCILDEAQHIKNPTSQNARAVKEIKAEKRFALTGTPMENALTELWSIFDFILPGYLFSHSKFTQEYESPIIKERDERAMEELGKHIRPFILRRLKTDVLKELPEKIEHKLVTELTHDQKTLYLTYLQKIRNEIDEEIRQKGFDRSHIKILSGLTRLRQICCHPSVFLEDYAGESGKMILLQELIQDSIDSGHRILLFSQFTSMLKLIREWLDKENMDYLYLDGSTAVEERASMVKSFNKGQGSIFLISLKAGGTGLNLTGADTVIHYDPWWNPAVEEQATDRAYRIGQTKAVHVMKLITKGTIEEKIFELQQRKKQLIDAVIQPGQTLITKMSEEEVRSLFEHGG